MWLTDLHQFELEYIKRYGNDRPVKQPRTPKTVIVQPQNPVMDLALGTTNLPKPPKVKAQPFVPGSNPINMSFVIPTSNTTIAQNPTLSPNQTVIQVPNPVHNPVQNSLSGANTVVFAIPK